MAGETVRIERLTLRVPGLTREEAGALGHDLARQLAEGLPAGSVDRRPDALSLRVTLPAGTSRDRLAGLIGDRIRESLR